MGQLNYYPHVRIEFARAGSIACTESGDTFLARRGTTLAATTLDMRPKARGLDEMPQGCVHNMSDLRRMVNKRFRLMLHMDSLPKWLHKPKRSFVSVDWNKMLHMEALRESSCLAVTPMHMAPAANIWST